MQNMVINSERTVITDMAWMFCNAIVSHDIESERGNQPLANIHVHTAEAILDECVWVTPDDIPNVMLRITAAMSHLSVAMCDLEENNPGERIRAAHRAMNAAMLGIEKIHKTDRDDWRFDWCAAREIPL